MASKLISIRAALKEELDGLKVIEEESYGGVIKRMIESHKKRLNGTEVESSPLPEPVEKVNHSDNTLEKPGIDTTEYSPFSDDKADITDSTISTEEDKILESKELIMGVDMAHEGSDRTVITKPEEQPIESHKEDSEEEEGDLVKDNSEVGKEEDNPEDKDVIGEVNEPVIKEEEEGEVDDGVIEETLQKPVFGDKRSSDHSEDDDVVDITPTFKPTSD